MSDSVAYQRSIGAAIVYHAGIDKIKEEEIKDSLRKIIKNEAFTTDLDAKVIDAIKQMISVRWVEPDAHLEKRYPTTNLDSFMFNGFGYGNIIKPDGLCMLFSFRNNVTQEILPSLSQSEQTTVTKVGGVLRYLLNQI